MIIKAKFRKTDRQTDMFIFGVLYNNSISTISKIIAGLLSRKVVINKLTNANDTSFLLRIGISSRAKEVYFCLVQ